jgi:hypothetical protein
MKRGISTNRNVTVYAKRLKQLGVEFVFRYYSTTTQQPEKRLTSKEAETIAAAGIQIGVVYEDNPKSVTYFSQGRGHQDGVNAYYAARNLLQPAGSCIYFAVDYDAAPQHIAGPILDYFNGVNQGIKDAGSDLNNYTVGVYGSGAVCDFLKSHCPFVRYSWLAESTGWLGSKTYGAWDVHQAVASAPLGGISTNDYEENLALDDFGGFSLSYAAATAVTADIAPADLTPAVPPNVDPNASDQDRANAMWNIVSSVVADFDAVGSRDNTQRFMMYIAWHEGNQLTQRLQGGGGPALSFFKIQGASAQTAYNSSSMTDSRINTLASYTGSKHDDIVNAFEALTSSASYPAGNLIGTLLGSSDIFGAYVARALLWTFPAALPQPAVPPVALFQPQADYWFQYWHGGVGDAGSLKQAFKDHCAQVDALLPAVPSSTAL